MNLRIPGPTALPDSVQRAVGQPMINHRGPKLATLFKEVTARLKKVFQSKNDMLILTASGTGGMEAAIVNLISYGDKVLAISAGLFGDRFANTTEDRGVQVIRLGFSVGQVYHSRCHLTILLKEHRLRLLSAQ